VNAAGASAPLGKVIGLLNAKIEHPASIPPGETVAISLRDENGKLLANFYETLGSELLTVDLSTLDLPSKYIYYLCLSRPESEAVDQYYHITWEVSVDPLCGEDLIELDNPNPPHINAESLSWDSHEIPGSVARMWLCYPDDIIDAYPFNIPASWSGAQPVIGGSLRVKTDPMSWEWLEVSLGLQDTETNVFGWTRPIKLEGDDVLYNIGDYWPRMPWEFDDLSLKSWIKIKNAGNDTYATAQVEMSFEPSSDCSGDVDSMQEPSGTFSPQGTMAGYLSPGSNDSDFWELDWTSEGRIGGDIEVVADEEVSLSLYSRGILLEESQGYNPSVTVDGYDFGPGCFGPILRIDTFGGSPGQCIKYFITGGGLTEYFACGTYPDNNDTIIAIGDKPWMWMNPMGNYDYMCGVVCRSGSDEDIDCIGILNQPFAKQGVLYGFFRLDSTTPDPHRITLVSINGKMNLQATNLNPPFYSAVIELAEWGLPAIPPNDYTYHIIVEPDPNGGDSLTPYTLTGLLGINEDWLCPDDGHDTQEEAWPVGLIDARLGLLCGFGDPEQIDIGIADLCDWYRLDYEQQTGEFIYGSITLESATDGLTVRLMAEGELAGTGSAFYEGTTESGSVKLTIPDGVLPSVPDTGINYYIAVHNNGIGGYASFALKIDLVSN